MPYLEFLLCLGTAMLLGTPVGLERQWRQRMARHARTPWYPLAQRCLRIPYAATVCGAVLITNIVLRPLAYRLHPVQPMFSN